MDQQVLRSEHNSKGFATHRSSLEGPSSETDRKHGQAYERAERVANLSPLRYYHRAPVPRFNYGLDAEEKELISRG